MVDANEALCRGHWRLVLRAPADFPACDPGQFINILCRTADADRASAETTFGARTAYLRRPFSIAELDRNGGATLLEVLHHVVGPGTAWMATRKPGDAVNILGPIGRPFRADARLRRAVLVGGGIGIPPLIWLARTLAERGVNVLAVYGVRSAEMMPLRVDRSAVVASAQDRPTLCIEEFARHGVCSVVCTDDGSLGRRGFVTDALIAHLAAAPPDADTCVFTCGPDVMMRAVADICRQQNVACQACLERVMGCAMGTCQSCVVPVVDADAPRGWRYRLCCTDGPVFDASAVLWSTPRS